MTQPGLPVRGLLASRHANEPPRGLTIEDLWPDFQRLVSQVADLAGQVAALRVQVRNLEERS